MNVFRVIFAIGGGHVHCRLFCAARPDITFAKCGDFVVRKGPEFRDLVHAFKAEFVGLDSNYDTIPKACEP
jgi:hypothetical protein